MESKSAHVAVISAPGMGHVLPFLVLARRLASHDDRLLVTLFAITSGDSRSSQLLTSGNPANLRITVLPRPRDLSAVIPPDARVETRISITVRELLPSLRSALIALSPPATTLVVDFFSTPVLAVADELNMSKYVFFTTSADVLAFMMHLPTLDREIVGQYVDHPEPIKVPGCRSVEIKDLVSPLLDRNNEGYGLFLHVAQLLSSADGILINTSEVVDATALKALRTEKAFVDTKAPRVYPIGPLTRPPEDERVAWLDSQPYSSVLYVSFGSGGTLSVEETTALAEGLEKSGQRFLWVCRPPSHADGPWASYFVRGEDGDDPATYLPEGFLDRTKDAGLVVPSWVPQTSVLSHGAVAAFLTHGGWNSTLECLVHGKPMIVWPLFAEQAMNATKLEKIGVGRRVVGGGPGGQKPVVGTEELAETVRTLVVGEEGKKMRRRAAEVGEKMMMGLEGGGSSHRSLVEAVTRWKKG